MSSPEPEGFDRVEKDDALVEEALTAMSADDLRELVRYTLLELVGQARGRVLNRLFERAARSSGWIPTRLPDDATAGAVSFAEAAVRAGRADPADVDRFLRQASAVFLARDYAAARAIFRALLGPIANGDVFLGQDETVDQVLGVCLTTCSLEYAVATYMTAAPDERAAAVHAALREADGLAYLGEPIRELERTAVEPLPDLDRFLPGWRALLDAASTADHRPPGQERERRWLREAVRRLEGADGLARVARTTRSSEDLRTWCAFLVEQRDWAAALSAHEEAAALAGADVHARGVFLDGAALAAQELGRDDLPARLESAWREVPTQTRLVRWLASSPSGEAARERAATPLAACKPTAHAQRALLLVLVGDHATAAELLAAAPGRGWSDSDHPGPLGFPLLHALVSGAATLPVLDESPDLERLAWQRAPDEPQLRTPRVEDVLDLAGFRGPITGPARVALLQAMRTAAERRIAGVVEEKRRSHYDHAARVVAAYATLDPTPETSAWVARLRHEYRRLPALQNALLARLPGR